MCVLVWGCVSKQAVLACTGLWFFHSVPWQIDLSSLCISIFLSLSMHSLPTHLSSRGLSPLILCAPLPHGVVEGLILILLLLLSSADDTCSLVLSPCILYGVKRAHLTQDTRTITVYFRWLGISVAAFLCSCNVTFVHREGAVSTFSPRWRVYFQEFSQKRSIELHFTGNEIKQIWIIPPVMISLSPQMSKKNWALWPTSCETVSKLFVIR